MSFPHMASFVRNSPFFLCVLCQMEVAFRHWKEYVRMRKRSDSWIQCAYERAERSGSVIPVGWPLF